MDKRNAWKSLGFGEVLGVFGAPCGCGVDVGTLRKSNAYAKPRCIFGNTARRVATISQS